MKLSANIELLFTEAGADFGDRVRAAADAGIDVVEIWRYSDKDLGALRAALDDTGSTVHTVIVEGRAALADASTHEPFAKQVEQACRAAQEIGCTRVVTGSGIGFPYLKRAVQHAIVVDALKTGAEVAARHGVVLVLENLNTRVDHPGTLFDTTSECLAAIRAVGSEHLALLFDVYHALQMGETVDAVAGSMDLVSHVQIADLPDRQEPGAGTVDWAATLGRLRDLGYDGPVGLEYWPTTDTATTLAHVTSVLAQV